MASDPRSKHGASVGMSKLHCEKEYAGGPLAPKVLTLGMLTARFVPSALSFVPRACYYLIFLITVRCRHGKRIVLQQVPAMADGLLCLLAAAPCRRRHRRGALPVCQHHSISSQHAPERLLTLDAQPSLAPHCIPYVLLTEILACGSRLSLRHSFKISRPLCDPGTCETLLAAPDCGISWRVTPGYTTNLLSLRPAHH